MNAVTIEPSAYSHKVDSVVEGFLGGGLFTHCYIECGFLDSSTPLFVYEKLPENSDIFDVASLTKALVTTPLICNEILQFNLDPHKPLREWLVDCAPNTLSSSLLELTPYSLLKHQSGLPAWRNFYVRSVSDLRDKSIDECLNRVSHEISQAKATTLYSDIGFILLARVLELKHGTRLSTQFYDFCRTTLQFDTTAHQLVFGVDLADKARAIPTAQCSLRGKLLRGEVHDENCWALGGVCGHAGLFASKQSIGLFLKSFIASDVGQLFIQRSLEELQHSASDYVFGMRRAVFDDQIIFGDRAAVGHNGFTGTAFWISLSDLRYAVVLTNRTIHNRLAPEIGLFRQQVFGLLNEICNNSQHSQGV